MYRATRLVILILAVTLCFQDLIAAYYPPDSLYDVGMNNYHQREYLWSLEAFRLAVPGFTDQNNIEMLAKTNARIGFILGKLGQKEGANQYYEKSRHLFESIDSNDLLYAIVVGLLGMHEESNRMLMNIPTSATALNWIGLNLRSMGELDSAIYYHQQALMGNSNHVWPHILIGNIFTEKGEFELALQSYNTALETAPENKEVMIYNIRTEMGNANLLKGDYQAAIENLLATGLPPRASNLEIAQRNYNLLEEAYEKMRIARVERNLEYMKMIGLLVIFGVVGFLIRQQRINSNVSGKLNKMYTKYLDTVLLRAIQDIDAHKPNEARKDIDLARDLTRKIKRH